MQQFVRTNKKTRIIEHSRPMPSTQIHSRREIEPGPTNGSQATGHLPASVGPAPFKRPKYLRRTQHASNEHFRQRTRTRTYASTGHRQSPARRRWRLSLNEWVEHVLEVEQIPDLLVILLDGGRRLGVQLKRRCREPSCCQCVSADHRPAPEGPRHGEEAGQDRTRIVEEQYGGGRGGDGFRAVARRERLDAALPVALNVAQVLGHSNHRRVCERVCRCAVTQKLWWAGSSVRALTHALHQRVRARRARDGAAHTRS
mmetsp:Transcript_76066/g.209885  ORF Transcript_76066/g.209885 Transcript_76066/m.209885 type:complete len:257 (+) Transcript_76066:119-889(+)